MSRSTLVHISLLHPHPGNIREDLGDLTEMAASIRAHGIVQPLVVQRHPQNPGHFLVVAGHRRLEAARRARLNEIPVTIRTAELNPGSVAEIMLVENWQRRDLDPVEKARAMGSLRDRGYTSARIAKSIGMSDATVCNYLTLLDLDEKSLEKIRDGHLAVADAIQAVRKTRARRRAKAGQSDRGKAMAATWEPDHFTASHSLARKAAALCEAREHTMRRRLGKTACGQCWETVIRDDERKVTLALSEAPAAAAAAQVFLAPAGVPA
jgi:ParB family transcriptional regulator, chromosome partitioning protein